LSVDSRYIRIATKFWQDEKARRLSDDAKLLYLYVLTSPHSNMAGYYVLPKPYVVYDLQWLPERLDKALAELLHQGLIKYCKRSDVVLIPNFLKYNPIQNQNQAKGAARRVAELPSNTLREDFRTVLERYAEQFVEWFTEWFANTDTDTDTDTETGDIGTCAPDDAQDENGDLGGSVEAEQVTAAPDGDKLSSKSRPRSPFKSRRQEQLFDQFWTQYPRKKSKGQAERAWVKLSPDDTLFRQIMEGLERAKRSRDWIKEGGQYVPYPATWLNAKGWEDEYEEVKSSGNAHRGHQPYTENDGYDWNKLARRS
jgi:hypothetical protein